ncbi:MAG: hypothetical protein C4519_06780 [Desulfobacteraceae bacterium]|nr:MAG: hypothetical protein C4519_06780 [Desulfobacteraceae bacterium]
MARASTTGARWTPIGVSWYHASHHIITSHSFVPQEGQAVPWQIGVYKDELIDGLKEMAATVYENGSKIVMQIDHAGKAKSVV